MSLPASELVKTFTAPASPMPAASAVAEARRLFERQQGSRWRVAATTARERADRLRAFTAAVRARRIEIATAIRDDFGKHPLESELTEIQLTLTELEHAASHVARWMRPVRVPTPIWNALGRSEIHYEPKGVVLIMGAWNFPFALLAAPLAPAIAAGNCVIMRPSERVPATNAVLARLVAEVFDESEVAMVQGDRSAADALLALPFDHIFFTGSTAVGRRIMTAAARTMASVTLELSGKCPVIVDESADIVMTARRLAWGKFVSSGQACVAPDYAFVPASRREELVSEMKAALAEFYGATDEERRRSPDIARVIDSAGVERLAALVEGSVRQGATIEAGGTWDAGARWMAPTILTDVRPVMPIMEDEIFGPVLPVLDYRTMSDVYDFLRSRGKPLAMYLFSRDRRWVREVLSRTSAGGTVVNNALVHLGNPHLPFGGVGESGFGSYHGLAGFKAFSHERAVFTQWATAAHLFYPPYGERTRRLIDWVGRLRG